MHCIFARDAHCRGLFRLPVSDPRARAKLRRWGIKGNKIEILRVEFAAHQVFIAAEHDSVFIGQQGGHIFRLAQSYSESLALTDSVAYKSPVLAEHIAAFVNKLAARIIPARKRADK